MCCTKNCRYESSRVTSPLHPSDSSQPLNFVSSLRGNPPPLFPFLPIPYPLPLSTPATQAILSQKFSMVVAHILDELWHFHTLNKHLFLCVGILVHMSNTGFRPFFAQKNSRTFQGLSRTYFPFFKDSIQCKKEPCSSTTWAILSQRSFCVCSFLFGVLLKL